MTFKEFQAWLDGFSESFDKGRPNKEQWEKVQKKMETVLTADHVYPTDWNAWYPYTYTQSPDSIEVTRSNTDSTDWVNVTDTQVVDSVDLVWHDPDFRKAFNEKIDEIVKQFN